MGNLRHHVTIGGSAGYDLGPEEVKCPPRRLSCRRSAGQEVMSPPSRRCVLRAKQLREEGGDPGGRRSAGPGLHPAQEDDVRVQPVPGRRTVWAGRGSAAGPPGRHPGGVRTSTTGMQRWNLTKSVLKVLFAAFTDFWENGTVVVERRQWLCPPERWGLL